MNHSQEDIQRFLAHIRKTIADSESLVSQAELRIAETDRMLERQGLTREQVMKMHFTESQMEAANAELKRRGMDPLEKWSAADNDSGAGDLHPASDSAAPATSTSSASAPSSTPPADAELENRQRKFGMMMKPFQI